MDRLEMHLFSAEITVHIWIKADCVLRNIGPHGIIQHSYNDQTKLHDDNYYGMDI